MGKYWKNTPDVFEREINELHETWTAYIDNHFHPRYARKYCDKYLSIISDIIEQYSSSAYFQKEFLVKLLGFENTILTFSGIVNAFAAMTSSFRNPLFLSFKNHENRKISKDVPCLLPLIMAVDNDIPMVFYHYRKQRILKIPMMIFYFSPLLISTSEQRVFLGLKN